MYANIFSSLRHLYTHHLCQKWGVSEKMGDFWLTMGHRCDCADQGSGGTLLAPQALHRIGQCRFDGLPAHC